MKENKRIGLLVAFVFLLVFLFSINCSVEEYDYNLTFVIDLNSSSNNMNTKICWNSDDCSNQILSNLDTIYCMKSFSCANSIISNVTNVWCYQDYSCTTSNFTSVDDINCYRSFSCSNATFNMINNCIRCDGYYSCSNGQFERTNFVSCNNDPDDSYTYSCGCTNATFTNSNHIECNAEKSCENVHFETIQTMVTVLLRVKKKD